MEHLWENHRSHIGLHGLIGTILWDNSMESERLLLLDRQQQRCHQSILAGMFRHVGLPTGYPIFKDD